MDLSLILHTFREDSFACHFQRSFDDDIYLWCSLFSDDMPVRLSFGIFAFRV